MNLDISTNKSRTLASEPGIPELSKLYYDKYDFDQGGFTGMTPKMEKVYLADVQNFYKIFNPKPAFQRFAVQKVFLRSSTFRQN